MKIRVCQVVNSLDVGGLEKVVLSLLDSLDQSRFELFLACIKGEGKLYPQVKLPDHARLVMAHDRVVDLKVIRLDPTVIWKLGAFVRDHEIDVMHVHNFAPLTYGGLAARLALPRPKVVYSEHNEVNSAPPGALKKFRYYIKMADHAVAVSRDLEGILKDKLTISTPVSVIHNGIDGRRFEKTDGARVRRELGIADDELVIGTAVVLSKQKGVTNLVKAAARVLAEVPRARFVVVGDGPLRAELLREAEEAKLGDRFLFPGLRSDIPDVLAAFDVYVLPSLWEGLPLALLEALCSGKPVVCTRVGGNAEVVIDGENGFIVPPSDPAALADKLIVLLRDDAFRRDVVEKNKRRFKECFSVRAMTAAHEALYQRLARG